MKYHTKSSLETLKLAEKLALKLVKKMGVVLFLFGNLGSGKTTFVQGLAHGLGIKEKIISPTFILIRPHPIPHSIKTFYHVDLYRLDDPDHVKQLGLEEILHNPNNITAVEWAEKLGHNLPKNTIPIYFQSLSENDRIIEIKTPKK